MDRLTQELLETRLRQTRQDLEHQLAPLEKLWRRALRSQAREVEAALERLYAVPWARRCFRCQATQPQESASLLRCGAVPSCWY